MKKILVIEDDTTILENTKEFLKEQGFDVHTAIDGAQGIQAAIDIQPDLIISDIAMPIKDGFEVCKILQQIPSTCTIPFIFLTAKIQKDDLRLGMQLGADDYLTKPFEFAELLKTVNLRLEKHEKFLKQSDERFFTLIDNPMVGVYIYQDNKFIFSNPKLSTILGYPKDELKFMCFEDLIIGEENNDALEKINRCIKGIQNSVYTELKIFRRDRTEIIIELYGTNVKIKGKECLMGNIMKVNAGKATKLIESKNTDKSFITKREIEVLQFICKGLSSQEIAEKLFITQRTIDTHRANLILKTDSRNTADLVMYAIRNGLVEL